MPISKMIKDQIIKALLGKSSVPKGLFELSQYFRHYEPIDFTEKNEDGNIVAISTNFKYGSIVTSAKDKESLDKNIKDAILTAFEVPSSYAKEVDVHKVGSKEGQYALA